MAVWGISTWGAGSTWSSVAFVPIRVVTFRSTIDDSFRLIGMIGDLT